MRFHRHLEVFRNDQFLFAEVLLDPCELLVDQCSLVPTGGYNNGRQCVCCVVKGQQRNECRASPTLAEQRAEGKC